MVFHFLSQPAIIFCGGFFRFFFLLLFLLLQNSLIFYFTNELWTSFYKSEEIAMHGDFSIQKVEVINMQISLLALQSLIALYIMQNPRLKNLTRASNTFVYSLS